MASAISHLTISAIADSLGVKLQDASLLSVVDHETESFLKSFLQDAETVYQATRSYKLTREHIEMVLESRNMPALCGYNSIPNYSVQPIVVESADLFIAREDLLDLEKVVSDKVDPPPLSSIHKLNWTLVEGVDFGKKSSNASSRERRRDRDSRSKSMERSVSVPNVPSFQSDSYIDPFEKVEAQTFADDMISPELQKFFVTAINLLRFDTVNSFDATLNKIAEEDKLQPLVPYFLEWAFGRMTLDLHDGHVIFAVVQLMRALAANRFVNCPLYAHAFLKVAFTGMLSVQLSSDGNDFHIRESAADLLRIVCTRSCSEFVAIKDTAFNALVACLFSPSSSLPSHYGALIGIRALGHSFISRLMPHLPSYLKCLRGEMRSRDLFKHRQMNRILNCVKEMANRYRQVDKISERVVRDVENIDYE